MAQVTVVGAGVIGLSCAVRLAEAGLEVDVLARDLPLETTSAVAGGLWLPDPTDSPEDVLRWARATFVHLQALAAADVAGVRMVPGRLLHRHHGPKPFWAEAMSDLAAVTPVDDPAPGYRFGWRTTLPLVHTSTYLAYLIDRLRAAGGTLTRMSLPTLPGQGLVVDCTGVAARSMAGDHALRAARGDVLVLSNPGLHEWTYDDDRGAGALTYVLPRAGDVVVGGTYEVGEWSTAPDPTGGAAMLARARALVPALSEVKVISRRVGLRPVRPSVRLEAERREGSGDGEQTVVHCYGHGSCGWTLSWGCAEEVVSLVRGLTP